MTDQNKYEATLEKAAELLQSALPIGEVKAIGRLEVPAAIEQLIEERDRLRHLIQAMRRSSC